SGRPRAPSGRGKPGLRRKPSLPHCTRISRRRPPGEWNTSGRSIWESSARITSPTWIRARPGRPPWSAKPGGTGCHGATGNSAPASACSTATPANGVSRSERRCSSRTDNLLGGLFLRRLFPGRARAASAARLSVGRALFVGGARSLPPAGTASQPGGKPRRLGIIVGILFGFLLEVEVRQPLLLLIERESHDFVLLVGFQLQEEAFQRPLVGLDLLVFGPDTREDQSIDAPAALVGGQIADHAGLLLIGDAVD